MTRARAILAAAACALLALPGRGGAADLTTIRVGRASPESFLFAMLDVGVAAHIWERVGLNLEMPAFKSDSQQEQAFVAGQIDFALGSGPAMGYRTKGVPAIAVAEMYGAPANMCLVVSDNGPVKNAGDLKGKTVTVSSSGSLTDWLVHETSREQGWGNDGINSLGMGEVQPRIIAMNNGQTAGTVVDLSVGYRLEDIHQGHVLMSFGFIKNFITHVIFASDDMVANHPDIVQRFLRGWFMTVAYAKTHKAETVAAGAAALKQSPALIAKLYDVEVGGLSSNGTFDEASVASVDRSLQELGITASTPDPKTLYTTRFVPVKV